MRTPQSGLMLLEALIAILIFSLGILGIVGLQASAVRASLDAKYRTDAALLANELIGEMWSGNRNGADLQTDFQGDGEQEGASNVVPDGRFYTPWQARVAATLPGVVENPPVVSVPCPGGPPVGVPGPPRTSTQVCITVRWKAPSDAVAHRHSVVVQII